MLMYLHGITIKPGMSPDQWNISKQRWSLIQSGIDHKIKKPSLAICAQ